MHLLNLLSVLHYPPIDPVAFHLGPLAIRWYGLAYVLGFFLAYFWLTHLAHRRILRMPAPYVEDLMAWVIIGVLVGGRLGWWLFYHRPESTPEPWYEPFAVWHGGMSFHGALIGVTLVFILWSWKRKVAFWNLADACALVTPAGLFFGRIANFINAELVGRVSHVPWAMIFPGETVPRHPSQLYEALLEGPILLGCLWFSRRFSHGRDGVVAAFFLILYGTFRFLVEFTREPDVQLGFIAWGWLTMGQLLSAVIVLLGLILLWVRLKTTPVILPPSTNEPHP